MVVGSEAGGEKKSPSPWFFPSAGVGPAAKFSDRAGFAPQSTRIVRFSAAPHRSPSHSTTKLVS